MISQILTREMMHKKMRLRRQKLILKIHNKLPMDIRVLQTNFPSHIFFITTVKNCKNLN